MAAIEARAEADSQTPGVEQVLCLHLDLEDADVALRTFSKDAMSKTDFGRDTPRLLETGLTMVTQACCRGTLMATLSRTLRTEKYYHLIPHEPRLLL